MMLSDLPTEIPAEVQVVGHRCRTYPRHRTNEDTRVALRDTAELDGVWCEIDTWTLADGVRIVWHDNDWKRVADRSTLPKGLPTRVQDATWDQVRHIRTKGGERVARLRQMTNLAAWMQMPLIVEIKNGLGDLRNLASLDNVWWYQAPSPGSCRLGGIDALAAAGSVVGVKTSPGCPMTPYEIAGHGSFVADRGEDLLADDGALTQAYLDEGLEVMPQLAGHDHADDLIAAGVTHLIVNRPRSAVNWTWPTPIS